MKFLAVLMMLMVMAKLCLCDARICYNCTGDCVTDAECKGSCMTLTAELGDEVEVRTCVEDVEEARCISEVRKGKRYKICYCNTERCNGSSYVTATLTVLVLGLLVCYN
ncbi:uncharacterized protein LOC135222813 [Macrobrachium nipponense]|uniref:uncharacterized protein LOC135222813 n=1 Tax=Macrobrachium nipponense TaxID=159736 RepID=UPI0030C88FF7